MSADRSKKGLRGAFLLLAAAVVAGIGISAQKRDTTPIRPSIPKADRHAPNRVFLERANELRKERYDSFQIVVGDVMFRQGDMFMYCDSAHFYENPGAIQAFGNVRMEQGDTLFVFADRLDYSDTTELAVLYADPGNKVRLINRDVTLTTDIFNYDLAIELGFYEVGGTLTDKNNRLKSWYGEYSPATKDALFKDQVVLHSLREKDTLDIYTEEMLYNTDTRIAVLDTVSTIVSADGTIHTSNGAYNTDTQKADLFDRSLVVAKNGNTLTGDTLYYNQQTGFGEAFGNIELNDTANKVILN
nr:LPS export ABC transporter periplasmic protein LptC [Muribaculaceae bacterium]